MCRSRCLALLFTASTYFFCSEASDPSLIQDADSSRHDASIPGWSGAPIPPPTVAPEVKSWIDMQEDNNYVARHECAFVQAGNKFYMFGGRESSQQLDIYDYDNNKWSTGAPAPQSFNHFQATQYEGLIWVIGAFKDNSFPNESPTLLVYVYDPAKDVWMNGPRIPDGRQRGGSGLGLYQGKFYLVGGNTSGHAAGFKPWLDEFDPRTATWRTLPDAPRSRDHFQASIVGDRMYAVGGRRTAIGNTFGDTVAEVDVYDFKSGQWLKTGLPNNLPSPRAGAPTVVFEGKIMIIGGESGTQYKAFKEVHALDPTTGTWSSLPSLNHARHGTQAIVSGQGVYVAGGSPMRGGGKQTKMEVYNKPNPVGVASTAGVLSTEPLGNVLTGAPRMITIQHVSGSQGVLVNSVQLGASVPGFKILNNVPGAFLVGKGEKFNILVEYSGLVDGAMAQLMVRYSDNNVLSIGLVGKLSQGPAPVQPTPAPVTPKPAPTQTVTSALLTFAPTTPRPTPAPVSPTLAPVTPTYAPVLPATTPVGPTTAPVIPPTTPVVPTTVPVTPAPTRTVTSALLTFAPTTLRPIPAPASPTRAPVTPTTAPVTPTAAPVRPTTAPVIPPTTAVIPSTVPVAPTPAPTQTVTSALLTFAPTTLRPTPAPVPSTRAPVAPTTAPVTPTTAPVRPTTAPVIPPTTPVIPSRVPVAPTPAPTQMVTSALLTFAPVTRSPTPPPVSPTQAPVAPTTAPVTPTAEPVRPTTAAVISTTVPVTAPPTSAPVVPSVGSTAVSGPAVVSFTLINATDNTVMSVIQNGDIICIKPGVRVNIRADMNTSPGYYIGSVQFGLNGNPKFRTEKAPPFALAGDKKGNYHAWKFSYGPQVLKGTPYSLAGASGTVGTSLEIAFTLTDKA